MSWSVCMLELYDPLSKCMWGTGMILSFVRYLIKVVFSKTASDDAPRDILEWTSLICSNLISCSLLIEGGIL